MLLVEAAFIVVVILCPVCLILSGALRFRYSLIFDIIEI